MLEIEEYEKIRNKFLFQYMKILLLINMVFLIYFGIYNKKFNYLSTFSPYSPKITKIKIRDGKLAKIGIISDSQIKKNISINFFNIYAYNLLRAFIHYLFRKKR